MSAHPPPVPPDQRGGKSPGASRDAENPRRGPNTEQADPRNRNLAEQGRQGNLKQNTTNKGFQQDR